MAYLHTQFSWLLESGEKWEDFKLAVFAAGEVAVSRVSSRLALRPQPPSSPLFCSSSSSAFIAPLGLMSSSADGCSQMHYQMPSLCTP